MTRPTAGSVEPRPASSRMVMGDNKMTWHESIFLNLMSNALSPRMLQGDTALFRCETLGDSGLPLDAGRHCLGSL